MRILLLESHHLVGCKNLYSYGDPRPCELNCFLCKDISRREEIERESLTSHPVAAAQPTAADQRLEGEGPLEDFCI